MTNRFRFTFLILLIAIIGCFTACQEETKQLPIKKLTNQSWHKKAKKQKDQQALRFEGPHNFFEFHHQIRTRTGDSGPRYATNYKQTALQKALRLRKDLGTQRNQFLDWQERGPGNVGGRTRGLLVDKRDPTYLTWLVGSAGGGIWKTTDGGANFELKTAALPNMATTTLAASDANPDIVYAGTGEGFNGRDITGDGIYKSLDGGETWDILPATRSDERFRNVLRLVVDPTNPDIILAATRHSSYLSNVAEESITSIGFIMKSEDGGLNWSAVYGGARADGADVQQIVADPTDFNILYATVRNTGILKSIDKGSTWRTVFNVNSSRFERMELAVSPVNPNILHFAAEANGDANLLRSSDGGANWATVVGDFGNWLGGQGWYDNTIAGHPYDENTVLVGGSGPLLSITSSGDSVGVRDLGLVINDTRFINLYNPLGDSTVVSANDFITDVLGLPERFEPLVPVEIRFGSGKKQMAHRHIVEGDDYEDTFVDYVEVPFEVWDVLNNRQIMVSFMDDDNDGQWSINEIGEQLPENFPELLFFHAVDYNANQSSAELTSILNSAYYVMYAGTFEGAELGTQALPNATVAVTTIVRSSVGSTFEPVADGYGEYPDFAVSTKGVHVDHHNIVLIPIDEETQNFYILNANDGGVAFSRDAGQTFVQTGDTFKEERRFGGGDNIVYETNRGYNTSQFYGVDKMNGGDRYIGGTQDNGSWVSPADADASSIWTAAPSGDGFEAAWNYGNSDLLLESSQFNNVFRSEDGGETWRPVNLPGRGPFITRIEASKQDPDLVFGISSLGVLKSTDFGLNWSVTDMPTEWRFNGLGNPIAVSEASPRVVWTGGQFNENVGMIVSADGGDSFQPTNGYDEATLGFITGIGTHPINKNKAYALFSVADGPKILETADLGQTWTDLSGFGENQLESNNGFPDVATFALVVMPFDTNQIWVGTEVGLFESLDGGASWNFADNGLPPVAIYEMKIVNDEVVLATHGRGIWSVSLPQLEGYEPLPALIAPQLTIVENGLNGQIEGQANLRAAYDSTILEIFLPSADAPVLIERMVFTENTERINEPFEFQATLTTDTIISATLLLTAYKDGEALTSQSNALIYDVDEDEVVTYSDDFDSGISDFARLGFNIYQEEGFSDQALHSPHPYPGNNQEFIAVFQKPIMVEEATSLLTFDEVVLVEIGDSDDFDNPAFYDFVTVEATNDNGQTWITLDGYDSSRSSEWTTAYNAEASGSMELIQPHQIGLSGFFEEGEVIYLRFRLVSDPLVEGWGWMIDNLEIKSQLTSVNELPESVALKNFPNPFTASTIIEYTLPQKSEVQADLYSLDGKLVSQLIQTTQSAGKHSYQVNTSSLASGMYICRFKVDDTERTLKWIKR